MPIDDLHVSLDVLRNLERYDDVELCYLLKFLVANSSLRVMVAVGYERR
jgi:hypothetical protein